VSDLPLRIQKLSHALRGLVHSPCAEFPVDSGRDSASRSLEQRKKRRIQFGPTSDFMKRMTEHAELEITATD
jgi:hypothetical protein